MRSRIATCFGVAAILSACGGSDAGTPATVGAPTPGVGAAGSSAAARPPAATTPTQTTSSPATTPAAASNPTTKPPAAMPTAPAVPPPTASTTPPPAMTPPAMTPTATTPPAGGVKLAMDECGLKTKFTGDEFCINPPPADKGFQMHIGPTNYDSPDPRYILQPGDELTENFPATSGNTSDVYYYWRQYRMRPGSHHLIVNAGARRIGGSSNSAKDNPEGGVIAPENQGVGMPLAARTQISNSFHTFNFTEKPVVKEAWVNFWYRDKADVTMPTQEVFSMLGMNIAPGQNVNKHGACTITGMGRLLTVYGHVHAHNQRFSVWRTRSGQKQLIHESYDWEHPNVSEYSSTVMNPTLDPAMKKDGGASGMMDIKTGDLIEFECQILNDTQSIFLGANEANDDEMCIMIGDTVGTTIPLGCAATTTDVAK